jgi:hypothetical protein
MSVAANKTQINVCQMTKIKLIPNLQHIAVYASFMELNHVNQYNIVYVIKIPKIAKYNIIIFAYVNKINKIANQLNIFVDLIFFVNNNFFFFAFFFYKQKSQYFKHSILYNVFKIINITIRTNKKKSR